MTSAPQTIQIFLPNGSPTGIRIAELTTRIVQVIDVPRKLLPEFLKKPESAHVGVYYLVAEPEDGGEPRAYVGQSGDLRARLTEHNTKKDFWQRALVLISKTHSMTQTHALFLEWYSLTMVKQAERYEADNGNSGTRPHTPAPMEADCHEIFTTGRTLLATLGHPLFDPVVQPNSTVSKSDEFFCKAGAGEVDARGLYTQEGFVVREGSIGRKQNVPSIVGTSDSSFRDKLIADGVMNVEGDKVVFTKDHLFRSPSMAAVAVLGRTANGWQEWKDEKGNTLHAVKRAPVAGST